VLVLAEGATVVLLDTNLTPELEREGVARDFNRAGQDQRKALDLHVTDRVRVAFRASDAVADAVLGHRAWLEGELLAVEVRREADPLGGVEVKVGGESVEIRIERA
jgi:isoleucyl-tRNA synthetase